MDNSSDQRCCKKCRMTKPVTEFSSSSKYRCKDCMKAYQKAYRESHHGKQKGKKYRNTDDYRAKRRERYYRKRECSLAELGGMPSSGSFSWDKSKASFDVRITNRPSDVFLGTCEVILDAGSTVIATRIGIPRFCCVILSPVSRIKLTEELLPEFFNTVEKRRMVAYDLFGKQIQIKSFKPFRDGKTESHCHFITDDFLYFGQCKIIWPGALSLAHVHGEAKIFGDEIADQGLPCPSNS
jgi:hypothetical protein